MLRLRGLAAEAVYALAMAPYKSPLWGAFFVVGAILWQTVSAGGDLRRFLTMPAAVFVAGVIQAVWALIAENRELSKRVDDKQFKKRLANRLGSLLQDSKRMYDDHRREPDGPAVAQWATSVEAFLISEPFLGDSYVARFQNGAGIPIEIPEELGTPDMADRKQLWCRLHTRRARLGEFIRELETN